MPDINCKPRNAYIDVSTGSAAIISPRDGRESDPAKVLTAVHKALEGGSRTVVVPVDKRTPPEITKVAVGKFLLVNQGSHTLKLYNGDNMLAEYPVCVGSPQYPTVIGQWKIVQMEKNPTWYNRGSTWADNMPAMIPPGPNNPLGPRAMALNGGGDLIHGTSDTGSIGTSSSHGCVRMYISDVTALYEQCFVGMPPLTSNACQRFCSMYSRLMSLSLISSCCHSMKGPICVLAAFAFMYSTSEE
jgi:lipoprotein-anchoring transpeptidase ErfK/SrfK